MVNPYNSPVVDPSGSGAHSNTKRFLKRIICRVVGCRVGKIRCDGVILIVYCGRCGKIYKGGKNAQA